MTDGWSDERLEAAFSARAAAASQPTGELATLTMEHLRRAPRPGRALGRPGALAGLAAAVAVALLVVTSGAFNDRGRVASTTPGTASAPTGSPAPPGSSSPTVTPSPGPDTAVTVAVALAFRDASPEPGEIQVTGWLRDGVAVPCPALIQPGNPARLDCPQALPWIVERASDAGVGALDSVPSGPALQPSFALVDAGAVPNAVAATPVEITVTGHFHDRRAILCPTFDCFSTFVVDRIDSVADIAQPIVTSYNLAIQVEKGATTSGIEIPPSGIADQYDNAVVHVAEGASPLLVLSRRVMSIDGLLEAEPALAGGWSGIGTARIVTSLTAIETGLGSGPPQPRTFLVPDGSGTIFEMGPTGPVAAGGVRVQVYPGGLVERVGDPITVSQAIAHRDHALDDAQLLVSGFGWDPGAIACTPIRPSMPVLDQCPSGATWLAARMPTASRSNGLITPDGPALNLVIPPESVNLAALTTQPRAVAVLGHFDDHRSATCPAGAVERCRRNFIVDAILDPPRLALAADLALTVHPGPSNTPRGTAAWAASVAGLSSADRAERLISAFPVDVTALGAFEPDALGTEAVSRAETVWLVHFLDTGVGDIPIVRTRLVIDADPEQRPAEVFDLTEAGVSRALAANP
jgi:hypothetical protein